MTTLALKDYLVSRINLIDDLSVLNHLKDEIEKSEKVYELSSFQRMKIEKSRLDFENGKFFIQEELDKNIEEWLKE